MWSNNIGPIFKSVAYETMYSFYSRLNVKRWQARQLKQLKSNYTGNKYVIFMRPHV